MKENSIEYFLDLERGELFLGNMSCELSTRDFHRELRKEFLSTVGAVARTMFYKIGKITGTILAEHFEDIEILSKMGWGIPFVEKDLVVIKNSYLSQGISSQEPVCELLAGFLAGWFTFKENENVDYKEIKCRALGDRECTFKREEGKIGVDKTSLKWEKGKNTIPFKELKWEKDRGEIFYRGTSSLIVPRGFTAIFQKEFEKLIGAVSKRKMYEAVKKISYKALKRDIGFKLSLLFLIPKGIKMKIFINRALEQIPERGFGTVKVDKLDLGKEIILKVYNSYNAFTYENEDKPVCWTLSGVFAGGASLLLGEEWECEERECIAKGDEFCGFVLFPKHL